LLMPPSPSTLPAVRALRGRAQAVRADLILVPVAEGAVAAGGKALGRAPAAAPGRRAPAAGVRGRGDGLLLPQGRPRAVALVGLGNAPGPDAWLRAGARGRREAERLGARRVAAHLEPGAVPSEAIASLAQGFLLAGYRFDRYRSDRRGPRVESLVLVGE